MLARLLARASGLLRRRTIDQEVDEELQFHLEHEIERQIASGLSPRDARREALVALGGVVQTKEAIRDVRTFGLELVVRDVRFAIRALAKAPAFTVVALLVLTLSVGASTAIFSVVDAVVLRSLPFSESDRLVAVGEVNLRDGSPDASRLVAPVNFVDWRGRQNVFTGLAAVGDVGISLKREGSDGPETLRAQWVTADFFPVLRVAPIVGAPFTAANEVPEGAHVAVISYGLWQRRYGGAIDVVGQHLPGLLASFQIVGVMPPSFSYPVGQPEPTDVWVPFVPPTTVRSGSPQYVLQVIGRLRDGVTIEQAQRQMDQITAALAAETPAWFAGRVARVTPLKEEITRGVRTWMLMLLAAVGFILLIAAVNLANLMLVRATSRARELGVRAALGASRADLVRALLAESLTLSVAGTALGVLAAWLGFEILQSLVPAEVPRAASIAIDGRVLTVAALTAIAAGVGFGIGPALRFSRYGAGPLLFNRDRGATSTAAIRHARGLLVVAQVMLAFVLLIGAGLFLASFARLMRVDLGFETDNVLTVRVRPLVGPAEYPTAIVQNRDKLLRILERVAALPGVQSAASIDYLPLRGDVRRVSIGVPGHLLPQDEKIALNVISPAYFSTLHVPMRSGRPFTDADRQGSQPVAILSDAAAARYFEHGEAVGNVVNFGVPHLVVGVVGNIRDRGPEEAAQPQAFVPLAQRQVLGATLVMRTTQAATLLPAVRAEVWSEFPNVPIPDTFTLGHYYDEFIARRRFNMLLLGLFGLLATVIASAGIYGVMAYVVSERTKEIGVRMALGATPSAVLRAVLSRALAYVAAGLILGLPIAWALSDIVRSFLFDVRPHEASVYGLVCAVLGVAALAAAYLPARRAAQVDPVVALRAD